jgi:hypothetical protein
VVRQVLREVKRIAAEQARLDQRGDGCGGPAPGGLTMAMLDQVLASALERHADATDSAAARVRAEVLRRALDQGPLVREVLMVGWVLRQRLGGERGEGGGGRQDGVDSRDLVAHAVAML